MVAGEDASLSKRAPVITPEALRRTGTRAARRRAWRAGAVERALRPTVERALLTANMVVLYNLFCLFHPAKKLSKRVC